MYYKKQKKIIIISAAVFLLVAVITCVISYKNKDRENVPETTLSTESENEHEHSVIIYKSGGEIAYNERLKVSEDGEKIILKASESAEIKLAVTPETSKSFVYADIVTSKGDDVSSSQKEQGGKGYISFYMESSDIMIHIFYDDAGEAATETESEVQEIQESQYDIEIKGLTKAILETYEGKFSKEEFVRSIGDYFKINDEGSEYAQVATVTFTDEKYSGEHAEGILHYAYFNDDSSWKILVTYLEGAYSFYDCKKEAELEEKARKESEKKAKEESEKQESEKQAGEESEAQSQKMNDNTSETQAGNTTAAQTEGENQTVSFSFNLESIPTDLVRFAGDKNAFFNAVFDYVYQSGFTGDVTGNVTSFIIEGNKLTFKISLSSGQSLKGKYNKKKNSYTFSGL